MKKRLFSTVICAAMVSTMVMGCSSGSSAPATTTAAATAAPINPRNKKVRKTRV